MKRSLSHLSAMALYVAVAVLSSCDSSNSASSDTNRQPESASIPWNTTVTYGSVSYAGQTYKTVEIGAQAWMAENLNIEVDSSWWFNNSPDSGAKYGRLYTWAAAMNLPDSCSRVSCLSLVQPKHRGICPNGWHVPSDAEWDELSDFVGGETAGTKLKSTKGWPALGNGTDSFGFRALPAGRRSGGDFVLEGSYGTFWSSSETIETDGATGRNLTPGNLDLNQAHPGKSAGISLRCIKSGS